MSTWNGLGFIWKMTRFDYSESTLSFERQYLYTRCTFGFKTLQDVFIHLELCYTLHGRQFSKIHNRGTLRLLILSNMRCGLRYSYPSSRKESTPRYTGPLKAKTYRGFLSTMSFHLLSLSTQKQIRWKFKTWTKCLKITVVHIHWCLPHPPSLTQVTPGTELHGVARDDPK